jgi:hypothetical protein
MLWWLGVVLVFSTADAKTTGYEKNTGTLISAHLWDEEKKDSPKSRLISSRREPIIEVKMTNLESQHDH